MERQIVVIGGGVIGTMIAYHLSGRGFQVSLVDSGTIGGGASSGNCGMILPYVLPPNMPGVPSTALRWLFSRNAPFRIHPGTLLRQSGWFLRFLRNCRLETAMSAARTLAPYLLNAPQDWETVISGEKIDAGWELQGVLSVFDSEQNLDHHETDVSLERELGVSVERLSASDLQSLEPNLRPQAAGAWFYPLAGHLRPDRLMVGLKSLLLSRGVQIIEREPFRYFRTDRRQACTAVCDNRELPAATFILATGAWTPGFQKQLGKTVPIQPGKGYSCTLTDARHLLKRACILNSERVVLTPFDQALRLGGNLEFSGFDGSINIDRINTLIRASNTWLREPPAANIEETWYGWRPMTADGLPFIDFAPALDNVLVAAGHNMIGLTMANGTGQLVADTVETGRLPLNPNPFSLNR